MRVWGLIIIFCLPLGVLANDRPNASRFQNYLQEYLETGAETDQYLSATLSRFIERLDDKRSDEQNDAEFLKLIFYKVHSKFLKHYTDYVLFGDLFKNGNYNCLTGTAIYALILDHFGFEYKIIETNYHIFLLVNTGGKQVLLEATDPTNGFVSNAKSITERIDLYRQNILENNVSGKSLYRFSFNLYHEINLSELTGLLYYNQAVDAFNKSQIDLAVDMLERASEYYSSDRISEFSKIILLTLTHSDVDSSTREIYVDKIKSLIL